MSLLDVINQVRIGQGTEEDWLLIKGYAADLDLQTECVLCPLENDQDVDFEESIPQEYVARGLQPTIDYEILEACVHRADRLSGGPMAQAACDVIRYYIRFDTWPETLGATDPPHPVKDLECLGR